MAWRAVMNNKRHPRPPGCLPSPWSYRQCMSEEGDKHTPSSLSDIFTPVRPSVIPLCLATETSSLHSESCWVTAIHSGLTLLLNAPLNLRKSTSRLARKLTWTQRSIAPICLTHPVLTQARHNVTSKSAVGCVFLRVEMPVFGRVRLRFSVTLLCKWSRDDITPLLSCLLLVTCREDDTTSLLPSLPPCIPLFLPHPPLSLSFSATYQGVRSPPLNVRALGVVVKRRGPWAAPFAFFLHVTLSGKQVF